MSISRLKYGETKNLGKHLVGKGKGITFAIPNDEVEGGAEWVSFFGD